MKYIHYILVLALGFTGLPTELRAQSTIGLYTTSLSTNTPALGDQLSIYTELRNTSTTDTFSGTVVFRWANQDSVITNGGILGEPAFSGTPIVIPPSAKIAALFTVQLVPSLFKVGPEIIIVWPYVTNSGHPTFVIDSAKAPIEITAPLAVPELPESHINAFVFNEQLIVQHTNTKTNLERIQILDIAGKPVITQSLHAANASIPLRDLPRGVYIADIISATGERKTLKFVR